jgi:hypothetical protein
MGGMDWIELATNRWWALVKVVMNPKEFLD